MLRRWLRRMMVSAIVLLAVYAYFCVRFYSGSASVKRNYCAEFSATALSVPEAQRGIDAFREAVKAYPGSTIQWLYWPDYGPDDPKWDEIKAYVGGGQACIEAVRRSASAAVLGIPLHDGKDPSVVVGAERQGEVRVEGSTNPPLFGRIPEHLATMRMFTRLLVADLRVALDAGDPERATRDIEAVFGLARHAREVPTTINKLSAAALAMVGFQEIGVSIQRYPGLLNEAQLLRLAAAAAAADVQSLPIESVRADYLDYLQRTYTDDGSGDGRFCMDGFRFLKSMSNPPEPIELSERILMPVSLAKLPKRRNLTLAWNRLIDKLEQDETEHPWLRAACRFQAEAERLRGDRALAERYTVFLVLVPAIEKAQGAFALSSVLRNGTIAAIAMERWRLRKGTYPDSLEMLVPDFLGDLPIDPLDGRPIKYARLQGLPIIYSAGSDGDDDGGRFLGGEQQNMKHGHWVPPSLRAAVFDGDMKIWPEVSEPRRPEETDTNNEPDQPEAKGSSR